MRKIEYILIHDSLPEGSNLRARHRRDRNSGYHYVVNSEGVVLNPIDIRFVGQMPLKPHEPNQHLWFESLNDCSIGIQYNGSLANEQKPETKDLKQREALINLLVELREHFPTALILGVSELDRWHTRVSDAMNQLRLELSNL